MHFIKYTEFLLSGICLGWGKFFSKQTHQNMTLAVKQTVPLVPELPQEN